MASNVYRLPRVSNKSYIQHIPTNKEDIGRQYGYILDADQVTRFYLPKPDGDPPTKLRLTNRKEGFLFQNLYERLSNAKSLIDKKENSRYWDRAKRKSNPYELVHVLGTNFLQDEELSLDAEIYSPLSRAFFKMIELYDKCDVVPIENKDNPGQVAFLAEGPGGFMEAVYKRRYIREKLNDTFHGMTLHPYNKNIPGWSQLQRRGKHPLNNQPLIHLHTGNLYRTSSLGIFSRKFGVDLRKRRNPETKKAYLVTCDGGFDYSQDFNNQEKSSFQIIFSEITCALIVQKKGGTLVCKMFDIFTYFSAQILYLLTFLYDEVSLFKPLTSRPANSEKYLIAKGFRGISYSLLSSMIHIVNGWKKFSKPQQCIISPAASHLSDESIFSPLDPTPTKEEKSVTNLNEVYFENIHMSQEYLNKLGDINEFFTTRQENYIHNTLECIATNASNVRDAQMTFANQWFHTHGVLTKVDVKQKLTLKMS